METIKFLCTFFFGNFWHWLGGLVYLCVICRIGLITISNSTPAENNQQTTE